MRCSIHPALSFEIMDQSDAFFFIWMTYEMLCITYCKPFWHRGALLPVSCSPSIEEPTSIVFLLQQNRSGYFVACGMRSADSPCSISRLKESGHWQHKGKVQRSRYGTLLRVQQDLLSMILVSDNVLTVAQDSDDEKSLVAAEHAAMLADLKVRHFCKPLKACIWCQIIIKAWVTSIVHAHYSVVFLCDARDISTALCRRQAIRKSVIWKRRTPRALHVLWTAIKQH